MRIPRSRGAMLVTRWRWPAVSATAFGLLALAGLALGRGQYGISAVWPANAVLVSALILSGRAARWRHVLCCVAASLLANWGGGNDPLLAVLFTSANIVSASCAAALLKRLGGGADVFASLAGLRRFMLAIVPSVALGATIASIGIAIRTGELIEPWLAWVTSDLLGMLLVTSLVLTTARQIGKASAEEQPSTRALCLTLLAAAIATAAVFAQSRFPVLFIPLATLLLVTYRIGPLGAVAGTVIVALIGTASIMLQRGPIALIAGSSDLRVQFLQFYLVFLFFTCLPLAQLLAEHKRLARERDESERRHRRILDQSREVIFETDSSGRWTYLNPAWRDLTGHDPAATLGRSFLATIADADRPLVLGRLAALYRGEVEACHQECRFVRADGAERWASVRSHLLTDPAGATIGTYGTIHDVTERKAAEEGRLAGERLYRLLAENSNDMIVRFSLDGVRHYVSPAAIHVLGYRPDELMNHAAAGAIHPDDRGATVATCKTLLDGVANPICTYRQLHKNGHYVWLEASYRLIRDPETQAPVEFIATVRDVGRRAKAELARAEATAQLQEANRLLLMAEIMGQVGHWRVDLASGAVLWSDMVCAIHGRPNGYSPPVDTAIEAYVPEDRAIIQESFQHALTTGASYEVRARIIRTDGAIRHIVTRGRAEIGPDGSVVGLFGVFQDVTDAHEAEHALRDAGLRLAESNRMLTMAEAVAHLGHWRVDSPGGEHFWSDEVYRIHGLPTTWTPTFRNALDTYHPDDRERVRAVVERAVAERTGYSFKARIVRPDGALVHVFVRGEVDVNAAGGVLALFGIVQDITEQAEAEALLSEREAQFRLITEQASDLISLHDADGRCLFMSPAARVVLGYDPDDMLGTSPYDYAPDEDHAALDRHRAELQSSLPGTPATLRFRMRRADRTLIWVESAARLAEYRGHVRIIAVCRDVTAQVASEAALLAARGEAEAAVRAKSSFLANMSHEIRTPMNGVLGFTELLLAGSLSTEQRQQAELIADSGRAMMRLLNDILDLSKVEAGQMTTSEEPFELAHALSACVKLVSPAAAKKGLALHCDFADDLPRTVLGDSLRLRQITLNLLGNATKFTHEGSITLRASRRLDANADMIEVTVEDTGIGIAPDRQAAIFEQFVQADARTAARFGGSGLGLAISIRLARMMGGDLTCRSAPGRGSCFSLTLPLKPVGRAPAEGEPPPAQDAAVTAPGPAPARVLVAEDNEINRLLIQAMFRQLGIEIDLAEDGAQAVTMATRALRDGMPYRIAFMDMQMPEMDGIEATRQIRARGIGADALPIIALTANAYADDVDACLDAGMQAHLTKPVSQHELSAALARWTAAPQDATRDARSILNPRIRQMYQTRKAQLLARLGEMAQAGHYSNDEAAELAELFHKLAGTAAMFGDVALGNEARRVEADLRHCGPGDRRVIVLRSLELLRQATAQAAGDR